MKEFERLEIIKKIEEDIKIQELLQNKIKELEELEKNPVIINYINLKKEILELKKQQKPFGSGSQEKMVNFEFSKALGSNEQEKTIECNHDIWLYDGSYEIYWNIYHDNVYDIRCENEESPNFIHNKYVCLECSEVFYASPSEWQIFEESHYVLKDRNNFNIRKYRERYYQLLFKYNIEDAKRIIQEEFEKGIHHKPKRKIFYK